MRSAVRSAVKSAGVLTWVTVFGGGLGMVTSRVRQYLFHVPFFTHTTPRPPAMTNADADETSLFESMLRQFEEEKAAHADEQEQQCAFADTFYARNTVIRHGYAWSHDDGSYVVAPMTRAEYGLLIQRNLRFSIDMELDDMRASFPRVPDTTLRVLAAFSNDTFPIPLFYHCLELGLNSMRLVFNDWQEARETLESFLYINSTLYATKDSFMLAAKNLFYAADNLDDDIHVRALRRNMHNTIVVQCLIKVPPEQSDVGYIGSGFSLKATHFSEFVRAKVNKGSDIFCYNERGQLTPMHMIVNTHQCKNCKKLMIRKELCLYDINSDFFKKNFAALVPEADLCAC